LEVLAHPLPGSGLPLQHLLASAGKGSIRVWAENSPFDLKDLLKKRGYRWNDGSDGRLKSWWTEVPEEAYPDELCFLQTEIYRSSVEPAIQKITAYERFRFSS
jgi:DNA polymerase-3 subunit epsilon